MFEKVSAIQYFEDCGYNDENLLDEYCTEYEDIKIPKRATLTSAGYDFFMPFDMQLEPNETVVIPTGIRWTHKNLNKEIEVCIKDYENEVTNGIFIPTLFIYPKSGLGFKYQLGMANTIPVIDFDYCGSDNEGHIMIKLVNRGDKPLELKKGKGFAQGIVHMVYVDEPKELRPFNKRNGGFGSSGV